MVVPAFSSGVATVSVTLKNVEAVSIDITDGTIDSTGDADWDADVTVGVDTAATTSTITFTPDSVVADNSTTTTITVTALDQFTNPISGIADPNIVITVGGTGNTLNTPWSTTNASGQATVTLQSTKAEGKLLTLSTINAVGMTDTDTVTFVAGAPHANSTISLNPSSVTANDSDTTTITVTALDQFSNPIASIAGNLINVTANGTGNTLSVFSATNASGISTGTLKSSVAEAKTVTLTDINSIADGDTAPVTFTVPIVPHFSLTSSTGTPTAGVPFNVTITAKDAGDAVDTAYDPTGKTFTFSGPGNAPDTTAPAYPNSAAIIAAFSAGVATVPVTLYNAETVSLDIDDATIDSTGTVDWDVDLTIGPAIAVSLAFTTSSYSRVAGVSSGTVTLIAKDDYGNTDTNATETINLSSTSSTMKFYASLALADADTYTGTPSVLNGTSAITSVSLAAGTADFWFRDVTVSTSTHTITAGTTAATFNSLQTSDNGTVDNPNAGGFMKGALSGTAITGGGTAVSDGSLVADFGTIGSIESDPATGQDQVLGMTGDANNIYIIGFEHIASFNWQWRIEKRDKATGTLVTGFGTDGVVKSNPSTGDDDPFAIAVDADYVYVGGYDESPNPGTGDTQWRLEKRDITTGALVTAFDTDGFVVSDPSTGWDQITSIAVDDTYVYAGGYDNSDGGGGWIQWRIEKYNKMTGALEAAFDDDGIITNSTGTADDEINSIAIDANYIYAGGYRDNCGVGTDDCWYIEKRDKTTGALVIAFGGDGSVETDPSSSNEEINSIAIDANYIYAGGTDVTLGGSDRQWRIDKRDITTGALVTAFDTDGFVVSNPSNDFDTLNFIAVDGRYIYTSGYEATFGTSNLQWHLEKRDITTGVLVTTFDTDGAITTNPSTGNDVIRSVVLDENYIYVSGTKATSCTLGSVCWQIEKRWITTWSGIGTAASIQLDVEPRTPPTLTKAFDPGIAVDGDIDVEGNVVILPTGGTGGIHIIDISDPANPTLASTVASSGNAKGVDIVGNLVYLAVEGGGMDIHDITDPANPITVKSAADPGAFKPIRVAVTGSYAYVISDGDGIMPYDISNPANPTIGSAVAPGPATYITIEGNYAYVAEDSGGSGFKVFDISSPMAPVLSKTYANGSTGYDVAVAGNYLYVAAGVPGLQI